MDNFDLRKYLAEGRLFEEKGFNIGDKRTIQITDPNGNKSENLVVVIPSPKGKEEDDIVWVVFLDGEFKGKISSYEKKFIAEGKINEGKEPQDEYEIQVYEKNINTYYSYITLDEDLIDELKEYGDYKHSWKEVQQQIKNDTFDESEFVEAWIEAGNGMDESDSDVSSGVYF